MGSRLMHIRLQAQRVSCVTALSVPVYHRIHPTACLMQHCDSSISQFLKDPSTPAALQAADPCQHFLCKGKKSRFFYSNWVSEMFFFLPVKESSCSSLQAVVFIISEADLALENSGGVCVVPLMWNMSRSTIWSSGFPCKKNSVSAGSAFSSSTFPSVVWKRARDREKHPTRFS